MKKTLVIGVFVLVLIVVSVFGFNVSDGAGNIYGNESKDWGVNYLVQSIDNNDDVIFDEGITARDRSDISFDLADGANKFRVIANFVNEDGTAVFNSKGSIDFKSQSFLKNLCIQEGDFKNTGKSVAICDIKGDDVSLSFQSRYEGERQVNKLLFNVKNQ